MEKNSVSSTANYVWHYLQDMDENNFFINYHQLSLGSLAKNYF